MPLLVITTSVNADKKKTPANCWILNEAKYFSCDLSNYTKKLTPNKIISMKIDELKTLLGQLGIPEPIYINKKTEVRYKQLEYKTPDVTGLLDIYCDESKLQGCMDKEEATKSNKLPLKMIEVAIFWGKDNPDDAVIFIVFDEISKRKFKLKYAYGRYHGIIRNKTDAFKFLEKNVKSQLRNKEIRSQLKSVSWNDKELFPHVKEEDETDAQRKDIKIFNVDHKDEDGNIINYKVWIEINYEDGIKDLNILKAIPNNTIDSTSNLTSTESDVNNNVLKMDTNTYRKNVDECNLIRTTRDIDRTDSTTSKIFNTSIFPIFHEESIIKDLNFEIDRGKYRVLSKGNIAKSIVGIDGKSKGVYENKNGSNSCDMDNFSEPDVSHSNIKFTHNSFPYCCNKEDANFREINVYYHLYRYKMIFEKYNLPFKLLEISPEIDQLESEGGIRCENNICNGPYVKILWQQDRYDKSIITGQISALNPGLIAHELGHGLVNRLGTNRPMNWCDWNSEACPLPTTSSIFHDFAISVAHIFTNLPCNPSAPDKSCKLDEVVGPFNLNINASTSDVGRNISSILWNIYQDMVKRDGVIGRISFTTAFFRTLTQYGWAEVPQIFTDKCTLYSKTCHVIFVKNVYQQYMVFGLLLKHNLSFNKIYQNIVINNFLKTSIYLSESNKSDFEIPPNMKSKVRIWRRSNKHPVNGKSQYKMYLKKRGFTKLISINWDDENYFHEDFIGANWIKPMAIKDEEICLRELKINENYELKKYKNLCIKIN